MALPNCDKIGQMSPLQISLTVFLFGLTFWLGVYLISRDLRSLLLWLSGLSLLTFAGALTLALLDPYAPTIGSAQIFSRIQRFSILPPVFFWLAYIVRLAPRRGIWWQQMSQTEPLMLVVLAGTILFAIGIAFVQFSFEWLSDLTLLHLLGVNLLMLGVAAAAIDAQRQGEILWPHLLRSLDYSFFTAVLFGGQVALVMWLAADVSFVMLLLLLTVVATAVLVQTFAGQVTTWLDGFAFFVFPGVRQTRAILRSGADAATRVHHSLDLTGMPMDEFSRLTRRALSQMGNLPKLAAHPLTQLPVVTARLSQQGVQIDSLSRALELKQILTESIARLKPEEEREFGVTDEWRHYNALHFPYVAGLRPYRRNVNFNGLDAPTREAMRWFREQVPPRTLYNWQQDAARLIARDLRESSRRIQNQLTCSNRQTE